MSESLRYYEIEFEKNVELEDLFITHGGSDIGYFVEFD